MTKKAHSDFLFAQPSFFSGAARVADMWGNFDEYNGSDNVVDADTVAIASDWSVVGQDVSQAIDQFKSELASV